MTTTKLSTSDGLAPRLVTVFLSVFDWTLHKGWDVLLHAFLEAFAGRDDVELVFKVWSTLGYTPEAMRRQAAEYARSELGHDLETDSRIRFVFERLARPELMGQYARADSFVLPTRGEGWGRPYMEALALGKPVIGTRWGGSTAFLTSENSLLLDAAIVPVPEAGWREVPAYKGHCWAEPDREQLKAALQSVADDPAAAALRSCRGQQEVRERFSRATVGALMKAELERAQTALTPGPSPNAGRGESNCHTPGPAAWNGDVTRGLPSPSIGRGAGGEGCLAPPSPLILPPRLRQSTIPDPKSKIRWEGAFFAWHSLAHVNRELCLGLIGSGRAELSLVPNEPTCITAAEDPRWQALEERCLLPLSGPADLHVRHFYPPRFEIPDEGRLAMMIGWEYGYLPAAYVAPLRDHAAEVWVYSHYVRQVCLDSGIPAEKLHVIPLGVDTAVFNPDAPPYVFTDEPGAGSIHNPQSKIQNRFVFVFAGGALDRKGIDILLDAYTMAFTRLDDVCLIIKDTGTRGVYAGQTAREQILAMAQDPKLPAIIYLDNDLSAHQMAGLYTVGHCGVFPYRGEGYCLPAQEAMACGLPVIVPRGGATDDFVDETVGWRLPAARKPLGGRTVGPWHCCGDPWMLEVAPDDLARLMRQVVNQRDEAQARGGAAARRVAEGWTWRHSTEKLLARVEALGTTPGGAGILPALDGGVADVGNGRLSVPVVSPNRAQRRSKPDQREDESGATSQAGRMPAPPRRTPPTISLCMIARDEERVIGDCLRSIKPYVDDMIVVDTGSRDGTVEIAKEQGARVFHFAWCDDFSAARNESLRHSTTDWNFWCDCDDTLPEQCGPGLRRQAELAEDGTGGLIVPVHFPSAPGEEGFTIVDHVKLIRNRPEVRFERRIHEQILAPLQRAGLTIERCELFVLHSGYDFSPEGQRHKRERDLRILAIELKERPNDPFTHHNIGMTYYHIKEFDRAVAALRRCLELCEPYESIVRKVYALLAGSWLGLDDRAAARGALEAGLGLFPRDPELLFRAGVLFTDLGDLPRAEGYYLTLLNNRERGHIDSWDVTMAGYKGHFNLAGVYRRMGSFDQAELHYRMALQDNPRFAPAQRELEALNRRGR